MKMHTAGVGDFDSHLVREPWAKVGESELGALAEGRRRPKGGASERESSGQDARGPQERLRVLLISHTCQSRTEGQPKAQCLAGMPEIDLRVLTPDRWRHYGKRREAQLPEDGSLSLTAGKVMWPWVGPAQFYLHWYPGLRKMLQEFRPHVIDLWEEPWGLVSAHACWLRNRILPSAKILSETEQNINKRLPFPFEQLRTYSLRNADFAVGRNAEAVGVLRSKGYAGPAEVVPNAVDAKLFRPLDRAECRQALGLQGFVAGYVGRLVAEKGLMEMVEALPFCAGEVNLLFVGSGNHQSELEERVRELGLVERVRFLANQPAAALPEIMNALDVLVLPSRTTARWKEQFGRVIIEAHACGTPVIGSSSGAIPEVIGEAGLVFPERDVQALAAAVERLRMAPEERALMGIIGRQQVEENYTWDRVAERMRAIYLAMCPGVVAARPPLPPLRVLPKIVTPPEPVEVAGEISVLPARASFARQFPKVIGNFEVVS